MRIHTASTVTSATIYAAAAIARADLTDLTEHGSRKRDHAFNVHLTGSSRRRPNRRGNGDPDVYAATWDQWGVFLAVIFEADPDAVAGWAYTDAADFHAKTRDRFAPVVWPADAHGDHTFQFAGTPGEQACTKCSARFSWAV